jgi:hypothetical protein
MQKLPVPCQLSKVQRAARRHCLAALPECRPRLSRQARASKVASIYVDSAPFQLSKLIIGSPTGASIEPAGVATGNAGLADLPTDLMSVYFRKRLARRADGPSRGRRRPSRGRRYGGRWRRRLDPGLRGLVRMRWRCGLNHSLLWMLCVRQRWRRRRLDPGLLWILSVRRLRTCSARAVCFSVPRLHWRSTVLVIACSFLFLEPLRACWIRANGRGAGRFCFHWRCTWLRLPCGHHPLASELVRLRGRRDGWLAVVFCGK